MRRRLQLVCSAAKVVSEFQLAAVSRAASIGDLATRCSVVFSMLSDDAALRSAFDAIVAANPAPGSLVFADMSTVLPSTTEALAKLAADSGAQRRMR